MWKNDCDTKTEMNVEIAEKYQPADTRLVEAMVSGDVRVAEESRFADRDVIRSDPSNLRSRSFRESNNQYQNYPERGRNLGKVGDGRSRDSSIKKERRTLNLLTNKEANGLHQQTMGHWTSEKLVVVIQEKN